MNKIYGIYNYDNNSIIKIKHRKLIDQIKQIRNELDLGIHNALIIYYKRITK